MAKRFLTLLLITALALGLCAGGVMAEEEKTVNTYTLMAKATPTQGNWSEMWFFEYIEDMLGIKVDITQVSEESFDEKKNLAFATNSIPDFFVGGLTDVDIVTYANQGFIVPLEEYITDENTPVITSWFRAIDGYESALYYPDGHIYNMQGFNTIPREQSTQRYWINKTWAETAIGKLPATTDEYYEFLKYIKDNDMDGDGDVANEIPLGGKFKTIGAQASYYDSMLPILFAFGMTERTIEAMDGTVQFNPTSPNYKEFLKYMNKLYTEGLLDNEYFTQTDDQYKAKIAQGVVGAFNDYACWVSDPTENWKNFSSNYPMTSEVNDQQIWGARDLQLIRQFVITNKCADPGDLLRLANFTMTSGYNGPNDELDEEFIAMLGDDLETVIRRDSGSLSQDRGAELGTWEKYPEYGWYWDEYEDDFGKFWSITQKYPEDEYAGQNDFRDAIMSPSAFPVSYYRLARQSTDKEWQLTADVAEYNTPFYHIGWSNNIKFDEKEAEDLSLLQVDLEAYADQMISKFIIGDLDIDAEFDNYVEGCKTRGLDRYVEIYQSAYDRWASAGK